MADPKDPPQASKAESVLYHFRPSVVHSCHHLYPPPSSLPSSSPQQSPFAPYVRTVAHKSSFFIDIIPLWNSLPSVIVNSPSFPLLLNLGSSSILLQGVCLVRFILVFVFISCLSLLYTFVFIVQILYASCSFHACLPVCCMLLYFLSSYHSVYSFVQILTQIFSILFAYLLSVFFIVQIHYASSCFVVRFCFVVCFFSN